MGIFKRDWWPYYDNLPRDIEEVVQSWDLSVKGGAGHDYVVCLVAARRGADIYLIDRHKAQEGFPETLQSIRKMCERYPAARRILVEDTANGPAVIATLRHEIRGIIPVKPTGWEIRAGVGLCAGHRGWQCLPAAPDGTERATHP